MKVINKIGLVLILLMTLTGCFKKEFKREYAINDFDIKSVVSDIIVIDPVKGIPATIDQSNNIDDQKIIKLETNSNCLIGEISRLQCDRDSNFYVLDQLTKSLFMFDKTGKFIFKIDKQGKGPGEYLSLFDFCLADGNVVLFDNMKQALFFYDLSGKYIKEVSIMNLSLYSSDVAYLGNSIFALTQTYQGLDKSAPRVVYFNTRTLQIEKAYFSSDVKPATVSLSLFTATTILLFLNLYLKITLFNYSLIR